MSGEVEPRAPLPLPDPRERAYAAWMDTRRELATARLAVICHPGIPTPAMIERVEEAEAAEAVARAACFKLWSAPSMPG